MYDTLNDRGTVQPVNGCVDMDAVLHELQSIHVHLAQMENSMDNSGVISHPSNPLRLSQVIVVRRLLSAI